MLFLDCEFNGHGGKLISMGITNLDYNHFYEVLEPEPNMIYDTWVYQNVVPLLGTKPKLGKKAFRETLHAYLSKQTHNKIYADSPADFIYFMDMFHWMEFDGNDPDPQSKPKYRYLSLPIEMEFVITPKLDPVVPHHALSDAIALCEWYKKAYLQHQPE